jgi:hypothetical protein
MAEYKDSGALFNNRKKTTDKHPDMTGEITVSRKLFNSLKEDADGDVKIALSVWKAQGPKGPYLRVIPSAPWDGGQTQPQRKEPQDDIPDPWA